MYIQCFCCGGLRSLRVTTFYGQETLQHNNRNQAYDFWFTLVSRWLVKEIVERVRGGIVSLEFVVLQHFVSKSISNVKELVVFVFWYGLVWLSGCPSASQCLFRSISDDWLVRLRAATNCGVWIFEWPVGLGLIRWFSEVVLVCLGLVIIFFYFGLFFFLFYTVHIILSIRICSCFLPDLFASSSCHLRFIWSSVNVDRILRISLFESRVSSSSSPSLFVSLLDVVVWAHSIIPCSYF